MQYTGNKFLQDKNSSSGDNIGYDKALQIVYFHERPTRSSRAQKKTNTRLRIPSALENLTSYNKQSKRCTELTVLCRELHPLAEISGKKIAPASL